MVRHRRLSAIACILCMSCRAPSTRLKFVAIGGELCVYVCVCV